MSLDRRKFLSLSMGGAAAFAAGGLAWPGVQRRAAEVNVTRRAWELGSDVSMTVIGLPMDRAEQALDAAFAELELVEEVLSLYRPGSQIRRLNRDRVLEQPHPYFPGCAGEVAVSKHREKQFYSALTDTTAKIIAGAARDSRDFLRRVSRAVFLRLLAVHRAAFRQFRDLVIALC